MARELTKIHEQVHFVTSLMYMYLMMIVSLDLLTK